MNYSTGSATVVKRNTETTVSLVLDQEAPTGTNPYVADITAKDEQGNMAYYSLLVTVKKTSGEILGQGVVENGSARITLPDYVENFQVVGGENVFYHGQQVQELYNIIYKE
jgi:hypothetical protein